MRRGATAIYILLRSVIGWAQTNVTSVSDDLFLLTSLSPSFSTSFSVSSHPAGLAQLKEFELGLHAERKFMLAELDHYSICVNVPTKFGGFGFEIHDFGYEEFKQQSAALAFAKSLGKIDLGIKFGYEKNKMNGYKGEKTIRSEFSSTWHLSEKLHTGLNVHLSTNKKEFAAQQSLSISYVCALGYEISESVLIGFSVHLDEDYPANFAPGIFYRFAKQFFASLGIATQPAEIYFAAGWKWKSLRIEVTNAYHLELGFTPGLLLLYQPGKK